MLKMKKKNMNEVHSSSHKEYSQAFKLKVVKLYQEEEYTREMLAEEFGISRDSVTNWNKLYQQCHTWLIPRLKMCDLQSIQSSY